MHLSRRKLGLDALIVLVFLALAIAAIAATFQDTVQSNFNGGTFNFTAYNNSSQALELRNNSAQELPANATLDGQVNMTGNILLMHFNETANATAGTQTCTSAGFSVGDSSENKNCGNESGGVTFNAAGRLGAGMSFGGSNDYVTVADANNLDLTSTGTIAAWIKPAVVTSFMTPLAKGRFDINYYFYTDMRMMRIYGYANLHICRLATFAYPCVVEVARVELACR